jgi:phage gp45-like
MDDGIPEDVRDLKEYGTASVTNTKAVVIPLGD